MIRKIAQGVDLRGKLIEDQTEDTAWRACSLLH